MTPLLSICIPTRNRAMKLRRLLASIGEQYRPEVEVLVSDNASTDDTPGVIADFRAEFPIIHQRFAVNKGQGYNVRSLVHFMATAPHAWIVGDDDVLATGAIARVLDTVRAHPTAMVVGEVHDWSIDGEDRGVTRLGRYPDGHVLTLCHPGAVAEYLGRAESLRALLGFVSNVIFPRHTFGGEDHGLYSHMHSHWHVLQETPTPLVVRNRVLVHAETGRPNCTNAETLAWVTLDAVEGKRLARTGRTVADQQALRQIWRREYPEDRIAALDLILFREPGWDAVRQQLWGLTA